MGSLIRTLVVDDDPHARSIVSRVVQLNPLLSLVGSCASALEAYALLTETEVDLLICDIEMPEMTGLEFVRNMKHPPLVIFLTSHRDYALACYEVSPIDFLVKPLDPVRFFAAIEKVRQRLNNPPESGIEDPYFFVREGHQYVQIRCNDVLYMKADASLLQIVTTTQTYQPILSIAKLEEQLKSDLFVRVHRSYVVLRSAISRIGRQELVLISGHVIPIGEQYQAQLHRKHVEGRLIQRST